MCFCVRVRVCVCLLRVSLFDYQAMCKMNSHSVSSARPLLSVCTVCSLCIKYYKHDGSISFAVTVIDLPVYVFSRSMDWLQPSSGFSPTSCCKCCCRGRQHVRMFKIKEIFVHFYCNVSHIVHSLCVQRQWNVCPHKIITV